MNLSRNRYFFIKRDRHETAWGNYNVREKGMYHHETKDFEGSLSSKKGYSKKALKSFRLIRRLKVLSPFSRPVGEASSS